MARPNITVEGRTRPVGDKKTGQSNVSGLVFTRIRGVRRLRSFAQTPRNIPDIITPEQEQEQKYQAFRAQTGSTLPEYIVYDYLKNTKKMKEGVDFIFQSAAQGGRAQFGGSVVDFELPFLKLMFRVQGERFHRGSPETVAHDIIQKASLAGLRYTIVDIWAEDVQRATRTTMEAALQGREVGFVRR